MNDAHLVSRETNWFRSELFGAICLTHCLLFYPGPVAAQQTPQTDLECLAVERAFASNSLAELKRLELSTPRWQALRSFRLAAIYIPANDKDRAREAVRSGLAAVKNGLQQLDGNTTADAALSAELLLLGAMLDGQFLLIDRYRLLHNGFRGLRRLRRAERLSPDNSRAYLVRGTAKVVAPWALGGSAEEAVQIVCAAEINQPLCAGGEWAQVDILNWLGRAYAKLGMHEIALESYQQALALSPNNHWVAAALAGEGYEWTEHGEDVPAEK